MRKDALGVLILRLGLAWFLLVWAVNKILAPGQYVKIWGYFHGVEIGPTSPYFMAAGQLIICACLMLGLWRRYSYAAAFLMHGVTVWVILPSLMAPFLIENGFPSNRNQAIALAAFAGFAALWLLRDHDRWSLDHWWRRRR